MKHVLILTAFLLSVFAASAQDIIVKRNGEEIKAKVEEIGEQMVRFRKFTNLNGPVYSIARTDVFVIRYESGEKDVITPLDKTAVTNPVESPGQQIVKQISAARKKLERKKMWEFGIHAEVGVSGWSLKNYMKGVCISIVGEDNWKYFDLKNKLRVAYGASAFTERYLSKTGESYFGLGLGYMQSGGGLTLSSNAAAFTGTSTVLAKSDAMFADIYYGMRPINKGLYFRVGARIVSETSKMRTEQTGRFEQTSPLGTLGVSDSWTKITNGDSGVFLFADIGYSVKHSDIGVQYLGAVGKSGSIGSGPWAVVLTYNYRF